MPQQIYTIGAHQPFARTLIEGLFARGLLPEPSHKPTERAEGAKMIGALRLFVPHRRGQRAVYEAFHAKMTQQGQKGKTGHTVSLLPSVVPLGDDLAPEEDLADERLPLEQTTVLHRRMQLATMLVEHVTQAHGKTDFFPAHVLRFSDELALFIDRWRSYDGQLETFKALKEELTDDKAEHWQTLLDYLQIAVDTWVHHCQTHTFIDESAHQEQGVERLVEAIARNQDKHFIVAGSSGTRPTVRKIMATLLQHNGIVVLPALDTDMAERDWQMLLQEEHTYHPQFALAQLLQALGVAREDVGVWHKDGDDGMKAARIACVQRCFAPSAPSRDVGAKPSKIKTLKGEKLEGVRLVVCDHEQEEARVIACLVRQSVHDKQSVAVIVPAPDAARRVKEALKFWSIDADDALGVPLARTPTFTFLRLILDTLEHETSATMLALLRHPCATFAGGEKATRQLSRDIETRYVRRIVGHSNRHRLLQRLRDNEKEDKGRTQHLEAYVVALDKLEGVLSKPKVSLKACLQAHIDCAEALSNRVTLWQRDTQAEAGAQFLRDEVWRYAESFPDFKGQDYGALFDVLVGSKQTHVPRTGADVVLYGAWEARMQSRQRIIVMGMNEDAWPRKHRGGIWLSPTMEKALGLPSDSQRDGLAAHGFIHVFGADEVVLTRAKRVGGTPQVESPFITRLTTLLTDALAEDSGKDTLTLAHRVDVGDQTKPSINVPPQPLAPEGATFDSVSISDMRLLREHPYRFYAQKLLGLKPKKPLGQEAGAADLGSALHELCARFFAARKDKPIDDPQQWAQEFIEQGMDAIDHEGYQGAFVYFYRQRLEGIAYWLMDYEQQRRQQGETLWATEKDGRIDIEGVAVTGRADRIQYDDNGLVLVDYKTGSVPTFAQINDQRDVQLTLEALIASKKGFESQPHTHVTALRYMGLGGRKRRAVSAPIAQVVSFPDKGKGSLEALLVGGADNLSKMLRHYRKKGAVYRAYAENVTYKPYADTRSWQHLAREQAWSFSGDD
ncbi:MAG: double-strand break repair protein AddB [Alphaproteobacteria bacterium GM202ARS2]|nr:double-strand break repair protein AddB [Alphaproteobacteria bacterium GM202ARS2]